VKPVPGVSALFMLSFGLYLNLQTASAQEPLKQPIPRQKTDSHPQKLHSTKPADPRRDEQRGTKEQPLFVEIAQPPNSQNDTRNQHAQREETPPEDKTVEKVSAVINAASAVAMAIFSGFLWWTTNKQWKATLEANEIAKKTIQTTERTYIQISHTAPGLNLGQGVTLYPRHGAAAHINFVIKNIGRTPAIISNLVINPYLHDSRLPLPPEPPYDNTSVPVQDFMYGGDVHNLRFDFDIPGEDMIQIADKTKTLYILSYVDYVDQFGINHRTGYARHYVYHDSVQNLKLVMKSDYNYDRPRKQGEGSLLNN